MKSHRLCHCVRGLSVDPPRPKHGLLSYQTDPPEPDSWLGSCRWVLLTGIRPRATNIATGVVPVWAFRLRPQSRAAGINTKQQLFQQPAPTARKVTRGCPSNRAVSGHRGRLLHGLEGGSVHLIHFSVRYRVHNVQYIVYNIEYMI